MNIASSNQHGACASASIKTFVLMAFDTLRLQRGSGHRGTFSTAPTSRRGAPALLT